MCYVNNEVSDGQREKYYLFPTRIFYELDSNYS